jgi:hypothetical protein
MLYTRNGVMLQMGVTMLFLITRAVLPAFSPVISRSGWGTFYSLSLAKVALNGSLQCKCVTSPLSSQFSPDDQVSSEGYPPRSVDRNSRLSETFMTLWASEL